MATLVFQTDPWTSGPPDAAEYGDPAWFRTGPDAGLFGPLAWSTQAERGFDWTDVEFFTKYLHLLTMTEFSGTGFTADLRVYGDPGSAVFFTGYDYSFSVPWSFGASATGLTAGTVTGFNGTIQGHGAFALTGLSIPIASLQALASRTDAAALVEANDLLLAGDDSITGSGRNDALRGGPGDDTLVGGAGNDVLDGGVGRDTVDLGAIGFRGVGVVASGSGVTITCAAGTDTLANVEVVAFADGRLVFEADDPAARVVRLYEAALDRLPDQAGLNAWIDALQDGRQLAELAQGFLGSAEFRARFGGDAADDGAFVDRLYQNVLGRAGEAGGRQYWVDGLSNGIARADVLAAFSESAENKAGTAALVNAGIWDRSEVAAEVARLYDTMFNRLPDAPGLDFWTDAIESGQTYLWDVVNEFMASDEFRGQYGQLSNRDFVNAMYVNALDRPAKQAEMDHWVQYYNSRWCQNAQVVLDVSTGKEHVALMTANIQNENPGEFGILFA